METKNLPVWLYQKDGEKLFTDADAAVAARKAGWKDSPADLEQDDTLVDEREELVSKAELLGIRVDKRWGVKRIQQAIAEHDDRA